MKKWSFTKPLLLKLTLLALVVTLLSVGVTTFFVAHYAKITLQDRVAAELLSEEQIREIYGDLIKGSVQIGILVAALAVGVAYILNRAITAPLQDLLVAVRRLQERSLAARSWFSAPTRSASSARLSTSCQKRWKSCSPQSVTGKHPGYRFVQHG